MQGIRNVSYERIHIFSRIANQTSRRRNYHKLNEVLPKASQEAWSAKFKEHFNSYDFKCANWQIQECNRFRDHQV